MSPLVAQPLTAGAFAPFGDVVSAGVGAASGANQGTAVRYDDAAAIGATAPGTRPTLAVYRSVSRTLPVPVVLLERHAVTTQLFVPMVVGRYLVVVAPTDDRGEPDLAGLRAFVGVPGQAVNYRAGTWHHPIVALDRDADFVMLAWVDGTPRDCEERPLGRTFLVEVP
jgi:ureidoglycolate lyase